MQLSRRDLNLYQELGKRYADQGKNEEAERAFTSIIEMMPTELPAMMLRVRESQNRWKDAAHWEEAAAFAPWSQPVDRPGEAQIHQAQWKRPARLAKLAKQWPAHTGAHADRRGRLLNDGKNK